MTKPDILPMLPRQPATSGQAILAPQVLVQPLPSANTAQKRAPIPPTRPAAYTASAYIDPYLFETGYYASPAEHEALSRTAAGRIQLRTEAENARPRRVTKK